MSALPHRVTARGSVGVSAASASAIAFTLATVIFRVSDAIRPDDDAGQTLAHPVEPEQDHILGGPNAPFTIVEYGDFHCGFCLRASGSILEVRAILGDRVRYAWRHAPLTRIHSHALATAEASEAAAAQGEFFDFARAVFDDQDHQQPQDIISMARKLGLDIDQLTKDLISANTASRARNDILDAEPMNITAVPTLFLNGRRHNGQYATQSLLHALTDQDGTLAARW